LSQSTQLSPELQNRRREEVIKLSQRTFSPDLSDVAPLDIRIPEFDPEVGRIEPPITGEKIGRTFGGVFEDIGSLFLPTLGAGEAGFGTKEFGQAARMSAKELLFGDTPLPGSSLGPRKPLHLEGLSEVGNVMGEFTRQQKEEELLKQLLQGTNRIPFRPTEEPVGPPTSLANQTILQELGFYNEPSLVP
jgi:hypothetical protein